MDAVSDDLVCTLIITGVTAPKHFFLGVLLSDCVVLLLKLLWLARYIMLDGWQQHSERCFPFLLFLVFLDQDCIARFHLSLAAI